ncbi:MAG: hypothetical protein IKV36_04830, partial [Clostridia bacterium]|nr:hypothetical protein [Clostridia bacterium]
MKIRKISALILSLAVVLTIAAIGTFSVHADSTDSAKTTSVIGVETKHTPLPYDEYYHYSSLSANHKKIYDVIYDALVNLEDGVDLSGQKIVADEAGDIYKKVLADHPEFFYLNGAVAIESSSSYVTRIKFEYEGGKDSIFIHDKTALYNMINEFNKKTKEILDRVPVDASQLVKEKVLHDILVDHITYDHEVLNLVEVNFSNCFEWCSYGAIVEGSAVCEGYSEAFSYLCHCIGINATTIVGTAGGGHMWNAVEIDNDWYLVDLTWDDADNDTIGVLYNYFNITSSQMGKDHTPDENDLPYPICTATKNSFKVFTISFEDKKISSNYKSVIDLVIANNDSILPIYVGEKGEFNFEIKDKYFTGENTAIMEYIKSKGYEIVFENSYSRINEYVRLHIKSIKEICRHSWESATCTKPKTCNKCGKTTGAATGHKYSNDCDKTCNTCGATRSVPKHTYKLTTTKKATLTVNGKQEYKCTECGYVTKSNAKTINKVTSFKLSATSYTYNGKVRTPSVVVKDSKGNTLKKGTDYTVTYASGRKNVGTYKVTIKMKGNYSGTKTLTFKINPIKSTTCKFTLSAT